MPRPRTPTVHPRMLNDIRPSAEAALTDECLITAASGSRTYDPDTKRTSGGAPTTIYEGPCAGQPLNAQANVGQFGDDPVQLTGYQAAVPIDVTGVERGQTFKFTASEDPRLVGRPFKVGEVTADTYGVLRILELEEATRG